MPSKTRGLLVVLCALAWVTGRPSPAEGPLARFHGEHRAMGTEFRVDLFAADEARAGELMTLAFDEVDRLEALLSNYRASSELSRLNRDAARGPVITDPETFRLLERAQLWSRRSDGAFDLTVGPLLRVWGFFAHRGAVPTAEELAGARARTGWQWLELDPATRTVRFAGHRPLELDPGSIGKGFAIDSVVRLLRAEGVQAALLSAGGSTIYGLGAPPGAEGWPVTIPDPRGGQGRAETVLLHDESLSTGACTEKFFFAGGHRFCHLFDPRTGRPVEGVLQATVLDASATDSDALSTVVFVLSAAQSEDMLAPLPGTRVLLFRSPGAKPRCVAIHWQGAGCGTGFVPATRSSARHD